MMHYFIYGSTIFVGALLIYLAYRRFPRRRWVIFYSGIIAIAMVLCGQYFLLARSATPLNEQQRIAILREQPYFITWYEDYKGLIKESNALAREYHAALATYQQGEISEATLVHRLEALHKNAQDFSNKVQPLLPPDSLSRANYVLAYNALNKMRDYAKSWSVVTEKSILTLKDAQMAHLPRNVVWNNLQRVYALDGISMLDVDKDIYSLKQNLTI